MAIDVKQCLREDRDALEALARELEIPGKRLKAAAGKTRPGQQRG